MDPPQVRQSRAELLPTLLAFSPEAPGPLQGPPEEGAIREGVTDAPFCPLQAGAREKVDERQGMGSWAQGRLGTGLRG